MTERRTSRRIRREIDEPGLRASLVADLNVVVSSGGVSSSRQDVHIRQRRSDRSTADPSNPENEEQS